MTSGGGSSPRSRCAHCSIAGRSSRAEFTHHWYVVPREKTAQGDMLYDYAFPQDFPLIQAGHIKEPARGACYLLITHLVHLEHATVDLGPFGDALRDRVQLRRVFVKRPGFELVYARDGDVV
jgi:hypothetical protein